MSEMVIVNPLCKEERKEERKEEPEKEMSFCYFTYRQVLNLSTWL
jgi:hypothetical protein